MSIFLASHGREEGETTGERPTEAQSVPAAGTNVADEFCENLDDPDVFEEWMSLGDGGLVGF